METEHIFLVLLALRLWHTCTHTYIYIAFLPLVVIQRRFGCNFDVKWEMDKLVNKRTPYKV